MCNCAEKLARQLSEDNYKNGRNAFVRLRFAIEAYIRPFVIAKKKWYESTKELRLSKRGETKYIRFKYCPICGKRLPKDYNPFVHSEY